MTSEHPSVATAPSNARDPVELQDFQTQLERVNKLILDRCIGLRDLPTTSTPSLINSALASLPPSLPQKGLGLKETTDILLNTLAPALAPGCCGPRYFGLVTGGVLPSAQLADQLVTSFDQNVQVHFAVSTTLISFDLNCVVLIVPAQSNSAAQEETLGTTLDHLTLQHLLTLLSLPSTFSSNCLTTGATASNILGLALGREYVLSQVFARRSPPEEWSVAENGFGGIPIQVYTAGAHASIAKAASIVGIGRQNVIELLSQEEDQPCALDLVELEKRLKENMEKEVGSIVAPSFGEVNTGGTEPRLGEIRELCDQYGAWLHIDAAFGAFGILHPDFKYYATEIALADSITSDAHKWLNVPYDCGLFFSQPKSKTSLFQICGPGQNAPAYLASTKVTEATSYTSLDPYRSLISPLFENVENSRRLRSLPVFASLLALGREGYKELFVRNIEFARKIEKYMRESGGAYEILTPSWDATTPSHQHRTLNIVLFTPGPNAPHFLRGEGGAALMVKRINESREMYVTGTKWRGRGAIRLAVSNWGTELGRDFEICRGVLQRVGSGV